MKGNWVMPLWSGCAFNAAVHAVMYSYYFMRLVGVKHVWWKAYITLFQIVQFCVGCFLTIIYLKLSVLDGLNCTADWRSVALVAFTNLSFLVLFIKWAMTEYKDGMHGRANAKLGGQQSMNIGSAEVSKKER